MNRIDERIELWISPHALDEMIDEEIAKHDKKQNLFNFGK